ncbi:MAG: prepilin-type N-terminal cleavage/methylation domain-containing protein [Planctomycetes bacterium]|nr:prepilin-type N-terminal cleavage/methylation domain-containing protein [Planctomycetota bacterium]
MRRHGFTVLELLVVIAILGFLVSALAVACAGMTHRANVVATQSLVRALDAGCHSYESKFGKYPGAPSATADTTVLYRTLCVSLVATEGGTGAGPGKSRVLEPFCELPKARTPLAPQIHDDWGWPVRYTLPGTAHADGTDNTAGFDIDASSTEGGVIGNWNLDR